VSASDAAPGRGKSPAERHVEVPAAPTTTLAELMSRPPKNTEELGSTPGPAGERGRLDIPAAPVVDLSAAIDRATRGMAHGL
jgi:hypothetical protein